MTETIMRRVVIVCAFLTLLVPFIVAESMFFPYITGKAFAFRILVEIMLAGWVSLAIINPAYRPRWSPITITATIFLVVVGIADMLGINPLRSFWSNFERMEGYIAILHVVAYLFIVGSVIRTEKMWNWLFNLSVGASVALAFNAFSELAGGVAGQAIRVDATLGNSTYFAVYLLFNIFLALLLAYRNRSRRMMLGVYSVTVLIQVLALYYTQTRGALLGVLGGLIVVALVILVRGNAHPRMRVVAGACIGVVIVAGGLFMVLRDTAFVQERPTLARFAHISLTDSTVQSRLTLWTSIGWNAFLERPLLGWGQDNFIVAFGKYYDPIMYKQEPWFDRAHNVFMDWAIAGGALGLLAYIALFAAGFWMLAKSTLPLPEKALIVGLLVAYAINNVFVFDNLVSYIYLMLVLGYIHARNLYGSIEAMSVPHVVRHYTIAVSAAVLLVVLAWAANAASFARAQGLLDAIRIDYATKDPEQVLAAFEKALSYGSITGLEETREQLSTSALRAFSSKTVLPEARAAILNLASSELADSAMAEPNNTRRLYFLAHFLKASDQLEDARTVFDQALAINPLRQNFLYEVGQTYLAEGDFEKAVETFKAAYDAETENDTAFKYYTGALIFDGKTAEAEALLMERFGTTTVDNELILQAYEKMGRNDKLAELLELRLRNMAPTDDGNVRVSLAVVYLELGRRQDAIAQIERAAVVKPAFAAQAAEIVKAIKEGKNVKLQ